MSGQGNYKSQLDIAWENFINELGIALKLDKVIDWLSKRLK